MSHTRKPFQWDNYASSTAVSDPGCVGMRANVDGTGLEASFNGAAWGAFAGGGGSPAGTGTELQYRNGAAFGAVAGSAVAATGVDVVNTQTTPTASTTYYGFKGSAVNATTSTIGSVTYYGLQGDATSTTTNSQPAEMIGVRSTVTHSQASNIGNAKGFDTTVIVSGAGSTTASFVGGVVASVTVTQKAITNLYGMLFTLNGGLTGSIGTAYGASIGISNTLTTVTTAYGLHINIVEGAAITNKYALVTTSGSGNVGINTVTPTAQLHVAGTGLFTGKVQFTPTATLAGLNVGSWPANPSAPVNGDIWYQSTANELVACINGVNVALGAGTTPRLDQILDPTAAKTFSMSTAGTDYTLRYLWDTATGTNNLFTIENGAADSGTGAALLLKVFGTKDALVVNSGTDVFTLDNDGSINTVGLVTIRATSGLGLRLYDGATDNVYLQYVGATPALRVIYNGGPAESLVTEPGTQTLTNKTLSTATSVSVAIAWADGVTQTFNPNGTSAGINVGAHTADPSALNNGDVWYNSTGNVLNARINGATVALGAGGGGSPGGSGSEIQYRSGASTFGAVTTSSVSGANVTWGGTHTQTLTNTSTSTTLEYLDQNITISPASASTAMHRLLSQTVTFGTAQTGGDVRMYYYSADHNQAAALTSFRGTEGTFSKSATGTVTAVYGDAFNGTASAGTITQIVGSNVNLSTNGGTITTGMGFYATADNASGTFTTYTAYRAFASGTITNLYGFASSAGFKHGFGTLTPTVTMDVVGTMNVLSNSINAIQVNSSGQVGFGHLDTGYDFTFGTLGRNDVSIQGHTTSNSVFGAVLSLEKSEGTVLGSPANVDATSFVAGIRWRAYRDGAYQTLAQMLAFTGNSFGASNYEGILRWAVTKNGDTIPTDTLTMTGGRITIGSAADPVGVLDVYGVGSSTAVVDTLTIKDYQTSGTAAAGFGAAELWKLESSTTASQNAAQVETHWQDATHATRGAVHRIKTVANASALLGRQILGCFKTIPDNTETALFSIVFGTTDHAAVNGYVQFTFIAKQVTGSVQTQTYHKVIPFSAYHNGSTNTGAAVWGTETLTAALTSTGGITFTGGSLGFKVNSVISPTAATGFNTATFQVQLDCDLTTISELSCYYNIFYTGQSEITLA